MEPRATPEARLALGAAFLRAARLTFLRSALSSICFVFIPVVCSILLNSCVLFHQLLQTVAGKAYRELSILAIAFATQHGSAPVLRMADHGAGAKATAAASGSWGVGSGLRRARRSYWLLVVGCWWRWCFSALLKELLDVLHRVVRFSGVEIALGRFAHFVLFGEEVHLRPTLCGRARLAEVFDESARDFAQESRWDGRFLLSTAEP